MYLSAVSALSIDGGGGRDAARAELMAAAGRIASSTDNRFTGKLYCHSEGIRSCALRFDGDDVPHSKPQAVSCITRIINDAQSQCR